MAAMLAVVFGLEAAPAADAPRTWVLTNPTGREYSDELVRLKLDLPGNFDPAQWRVLEDGQEVPAQLEQVEGKSFLWVAAKLGKGQKRSYLLENAPPRTFPPRVTVRREQDAFVLDNGLTAVRVTAAMAGEALPPPVQAVRLPDGKWVGRGHWRTDRRLASFEAKVVGEGPLFGKVRLEYRFEGTAGIEAVPAFYRARIHLPPDRRHVVIEEAYEASRGSYWEFDAAHGWSPRQALTIPHYGGADRPTIMDKEGHPYPFPPVSLRYGQTRMGDTLLNLVPRWSQAYDDGWFFMTHDGAHAVGALPCRAGKWLWPYDSMIEIKVKESADYAGFRCPTWRGKRYWYLLVGPQDTWADKPRCEDYVVRHSFEALDKIHQEYLLDWPGLQPPLGADGKPVATPEEYAEPAGRFGRRSRPFFGWGSVGGGSIAGGEHPITALIRAQVYLDPDTFGNYWLFFSPENPNFATSWWGPAYSEAAKCAGHPRFKDLARLVEMKLREDYYHSITVPGGAGQECPGYMSLGTWLYRAKFCKEHFGFDAAQWPQFKAAGSFPIHASQPMPDGSRRSHPGGDTHPPGPNVMEVPKWYGVTDDPATFVTEELPGFGVIFRNRPATPRETYLAFKSGPNRGHFHGDQLSFHFCAYGRPLAVDHHCSYAPRAGQEHMHNRVAFHTDKLPWANMDGYERVIALKTSPRVDVAIGQVESERLRITEKYPPEKWDTYLPQEVFAAPLKYRRTVVFLKNEGWDCFVVRDQHAGPDVCATYCLHVLGERCERKDNVFGFDGMQLFMVKPTEFSVSRHDWEHEYGGKETTKGLRATVKGTETEFVTVLMPRPIKRGSTARFVLKDVFQEEVREKGAKPEMQKVDLLVVVAFEAGRLRCRQAYVRELAARKQALVFLGSAADGGEGANILRLSAEGVRGRFQKDRVKLDCTLRMERQGDGLSGSYAGTLWDVAAIRAREKGEQAAGKELSGQVSATLEHDVYPPVPLFDDAWQPPPVEARPGGVRVGEIEVRFGGGLDDDEAIAYVTVTEGKETLLSITGRDINMDRFQGEIGLFVPDAGYPFGVIPDWLIRQRCKKPEWYQDLWPLTTLWP
jgi:hypothetical protein